MTLLVLLWHYDGFVVGAVHIQIPLCFEINDTMYFDVAECMWQ
jgi:hypothetical protein